MKLPWLLRWVGLRTLLCLLLLNVLRSLRWSFGLRGQRRGALGFLLSAVLLLLSFGGRLSGDAVLLSLRVRNKWSQSRSTPTDDTTTNPSERGP